MSINIKHFLKKRVVQIFLVIVLIFVVGYAYDGVQYYRARNYTGWQRAEYFTQQFIDKYNISEKSRSENISLPNLEPDKDIIFLNGFYIFRFNSQTSVLTISINNFDGKPVEAGKTPSDAFMQAYTALSDPKIGGMFDQAGGYFTHSDSWEYLYLTRDYKTDNITLDQFMETIDHQRSVSSRWMTSWHGVVADISHGALPAPTSPVTLENNPYK